MSDGDNFQQQVCCAAGVCCGDGKEITALAKLLQKFDATLTDAQANEAAKFMHQVFTLLPKPWGMDSVIRQIQQHPYDGK